MHNFHKEQRKTEKVNDTDRQSNNHGQLYYILAIDNQGIDKDREELKYYKPQFSK